MFTTMDVYDAASSIGRECQLIIGEYGQEILDNIMPKIIFVLEELESCTACSDAEKVEIERLHGIADELRQDLKVQLEMKEKYEKNLEQLEQSWYCETQKLLKQVEDLEQENNQLTHELMGTMNRDESIQNITDSNKIQLKKSDLTLSLPKSNVASIVLGKVKLDSENRTAMKQIHDDENRKQSNSPIEEDLSLMISSLFVETEERIQMSEQEARAADLQLIKQLKECVALNYKTVRQIRRELTEVTATLDAAEEEVCRLARQSGHLMALRAPHRRQTGQLVAEKASLEAQLCLKERELSKLDRVISDSDNNNNNNNSISSSNYLISLSAGQGIESMPNICSTTQSDEMISLEELRYLLHERNELRSRLIELEEELRIRELENLKDPEVEGPMLPEPLEKLRPNWPHKPNIKTIFQNLLHRLTEHSNSIKLTN